MARTRRDAKKRSLKLRRENAEGDTDSQLPSDFFSIGREMQIGKSGVREVFTPHQPIAHAGMLSGRQGELRKMLETINTPGQHLLLFGERGVGKSSLANVAQLVAQIASKKTPFVKRCDGSDTFVSIVQGPLRAVGADLTLVEVARKQDRQVGATLSAGPLSVDGQSARSVIQTYQATGSLSPSTVADALSSLDGVFLVDEADAIRKPEDKKQLAELVKLLSDARSNFKIMIVGVAETAEELTAAHPSVARCLRETRVSRMEDAELSDIVTGGAKKVALTFDPEVVNAIVEMSAGYPHFTHLLALKCAESAVVEGRTRIELEHLRRALSDAVTDAEGTLRSQYQRSVRSLSPAYRDILKATARLGPGEVAAAELRDSYFVVTGEHISQGSLNNYLKRLVTGDGSTIMRRTGHGHYRFSDPRMASFVRIVNGML